MSSPFRTSARRERRTGFTLVELLAVIALAALLAGMFSFVALSNGGGSVESARRLAAGQFSGARHRALLQGTRTRVLIHADPAEPDRYLREIGIVVADSGAGSATRWVAAGPGERLPRGTFFVPGIARSAGTQPPDTMRLTFPTTEPQAAGDGDRYYYFGFNAAGQAEEPGTQVVFEAGRMEPSGDGFAFVPAYTGGEARKQGGAGFLLLRMGSLAFFPEADAIQGEW